MKATEKRLRDNVRVAVEEEVSRYWTSGQEKMATVGNINLLSTRGSLFWPDGMEMWERGEIIFYAIAELEKNKAIERISVPYAKYYGTAFVPLNKEFVVVVKK